MPKTDRTRFDYMPGPAALQALTLAESLLPGVRPQALLDRLVITAVSALAHKHWQPPRLYGKDRDAWKLPEGLAKVDGQ